MSGGADMRDVDLVAYCELHCRTERALFHRDHVARMYGLANQGHGPYGLPEFVSVRENVMLPLVEAARKNLVVYRPTAWERLDQGIV